MNRTHPIILAGLLLLVPGFFPGPAGADYSGDTEKPRPEFTRAGDNITAKFIPRAKSTSVEVQFSAGGGKLEEVKGLDFDAYERPEIDVKNFKSSIFEIRVEDVPTGGEAAVSVVSDFFSRSTKFYVFNPAASPNWTDPNVENISHPDRVQELVIRVQDGGPLDSDGRADGRIILVGGPRDSFWGYALGTLFIRFFGIFLVLGILMAGMFASGKIFQNIEKPKPAPKTTPPPRPEEAETGGELSPEAAAAVALALHLHITAERTLPVTFAEITEKGAWAQSGRARLMTDRFQTFTRRLR